MPDVLEVNCETGEAIERDFTLEEQARREDDAQAYEAQIALEAEVQAQKEADIATLSSELSPAAFEALSRLTGIAAPSDTS